jgi:hypothetical protein
MGDKFPADVRGKETQIVADFGSAAICVFQLGK